MSHSGSVSTAGQMWKCCGPWALAAFGGARSRVPAINDATPALICLVVFNGVPLLGGARQLVGLSSTLNEAGIAARGVVVSRRYFAR
jgi:hypothetical protein